MFLHWNNMWTIWNSFLGIFLATMIGKAIIRTHIQTVFIISVCNNQLLHWIDNELLWVLSFIPGFSSMLPNLTTKPLGERQALGHQTSCSFKCQGDEWDFSHFHLEYRSLDHANELSCKACEHNCMAVLKKQQDKEIAALKDLSSEEHSDD